MAEVFAVVGAILGFAQLAGQIISSIKTIHSFVHKVVDPPKQVLSLLEELDSTSKFLQILPESSDGDEETLKSLRVANRVLDELQELLETLNISARQKGWKGKLRWGSLKALGKGQVIRGMVERLERAKSSLNGALFHHLMYECHFASLTLGT